MKRSLWLFLVLLLICAPAHAAISLVSHNTASSTPPSLTLTGVTCSAGDTILVQASITDNSAPILSGETFTLIVTMTSTRIYKCTAASSHSSASITFTESTFTPHGAEFAAYTGVNSLNFGSTGTGSGGGSSSTLSASVTTAANNSLVTLWGEFTANGTIPWAALGAYTLVNSFTYSGAEMGNEEANAVTATSGTSVTPTMTVTASGGSWSAVAISLSPTGGATPTRRRSPAVQAIL